MDRGRKGDGVLSAVAELFDLPGDTRVLCGHGDETTIAAERARYRL